MIRRAIGPAFVLALLTGAASAQGVDYYEFRQLEKRLEQSEGELQRLSNAVSGGDFLTRLEQVKAEISRVTNELEQLEFRMRQHEQQSKQKLEDLEYRIIELEGGDPSILFQSDDPVQPLPQQQGSLTAPEQPSGGTLGTLTTNATGQTLAAPATSAEQAAFDAGVLAAQAGRQSDAKTLLEGFVTQYPDSPKAGEAYHWLGESYLAGGDYQSAASRFLDAATLYPSNAKAPDSLVKLGMTLSLMGQSQVACSTLAEVRQRYPGAAGAVQQADLEAQRAGCS